MCTDTDSVTDHDPFAESLIVCDAECSGDAVAVIYPIPSYHAHVFADYNGKFDEFSNSNAICDAKSDADSKSIPHSYSNTNTYSQSDTDENWNSIVLNNSDTEPNDERVNHRLRNSNSHPDYHRDTDSKRLCDKKSIGDALIHAAWRSNV